MSDKRNKVAALIYALEHVVYDDGALDNWMWRWDAIMKAAEDHGHMGDCTKQACSCALCQIEEHQRVADIVLGEDFDISDMHDENAQLRADIKRSRGYQSGEAPEGVGMIVVNAGLQGYGIAEWMGVEYGWAFSPDDYLGLWQDHWRWAALPMDVPE